LSRPVEADPDLASERDVNAAAPADPSSQRVDVTAADFPARDSGTDTFRGDLPANPAMIGRKRRWMATP
jgi:hypothetical protein